MKPKWYLVPIFHIYLKEHIQNFRKLQEMKRTLLCFNRAIWQNDYLHPIKKVDVATSTLLI